MRIVGLGWRFGFLGSSYERDCYWTAPLNNCFHKNILLNPYQLPVRRFPLRCVGLMLRDPRRWFGCGDSSAARLFALKLRCKRLMHCTVYIQICIYIYMYSIYIYYMIYVAHVTIQWRYEISLWGLAMPGLFSEKTLYLREELIRNPRGHYIWHQPKQSTVL